MEYYSAIKKYKIMPFAATWMDLEIVILSEVRQRKTIIMWYRLYVESKKMGFPSGSDGKASAYNVETRV